MSLQHWLNSTQMTTGENSLFMLTMQGLTPVNNVELFAKKMDCGSLSIHPAYLISHHPTSFYSVMSTNVSKKWCFHYTIQHIVLFALPPRRFAALKLQGVAQLFIPVALEREELMKAFLVALENGVDFALVLVVDAKFSNLGFREAVAAFEEALGIWKEFDLVAP
jgi:hypothetical protein